METETFDSLGLSEQILASVRSEGYTTPTPIQAQAIPSLLQGRDLIGCAQTGTGKTAAFALPMLQILSHDKRQTRQYHTRSLVLTPTRELASQIAESFRTYGKNCKLRMAVIFGGVGQEPQVRALRGGVDILVATPGRLLDLMQQGYLNLEDTQIFVLDEADRMLDMGFIQDIQKILPRLPAQKQSLLFSATMPRPIVELARGFLNDPIQVSVEPEKLTADRIEQKVLFVKRDDKIALLQQIITEDRIQRAVIFTRTKHVANRVAEKLSRARIFAEAIHGNKSQGARTRALDAFKSGRVKALVATDIAARGIDIDGITHVINFELPNEPQMYVHRIGRTARAGAEGVAISFCDPQERAYLNDIEHLLDRKVPVLLDHPFHSEEARNSTEPRPPQRGGGGGGNFHRQRAGPRRDYNRRGPPRRR